MFHYLSRLFGRLLRLLVALVLLVAVAAGTVLAITGYDIYRDATKARPIAQAMAEVQAQPDYTPLEQIPLIYQQAVVATEDHRFYKHHGFDIIGLGRALVRNLTSGSIEEGGSTITQQLARTLYYSQEQKLSRKVAELITAMQLERHYSKDEILAAYINHIYYGDGYYTLAAASWGYFGVPPAAMSDGQATLLAGVPNAPSRYAPTVNYALARERQQHVLAAMVDNGYLTSDEAAAIYQQG